jgi:signal transduction histidine kinase
MPDPVPPDPAEPPQSPLPTDLLRRLTGSLAHNLNNRLTGVIGCLEWVLAEMEPDAPQAERLRNGLTCALQAAEMVRRMVMFAFRPVGLSSSSLVSLGEVAVNAGERIRELNLPGLSVEVIPSAARLARGNPILAQMAKEQLVQNAIEAMPSGGVLTLSVYDDGPHVCLSIRDTGPGLTDRAAAQLFEPFVTTQTAGHLGLGLVLCRDLMEAQGGSVKLTWEAGRGTTATLCFPAQREEGENSPPSRDQAAPSSSETLWHVI